MRLAPLSLHKIDTQRNQVKKYDGKRCITWGGRQYTEARMDPQQVNPQGPTGTWEQAESRKKGANGCRIRKKMQAHSTGHRASGGGWRLAGVGNIQVDGVLCQEMRWGGGVT